MTKRPGGNHVEWHRRRGGRFLIGIALAAAVAFGLPADRATGQDGGLPAEKPPAERGAASPEAAPQEGSGEEAAASSAPIGPLRDFLVLPSVGRYGRAPLHLDAVEAQLVRGRFGTPRVGQALAAPDGRLRQWQQARAGDDGWLSDSALRGGYAFATVESPRPQVMLLTAQGNGLVYVNGVPRAGDPYNTGWLQLPIALRKGTNRLLFHVARGRFRAELSLPERGALVTPRDATLPDLLPGQKGTPWGAVVVTNATTRPLGGAVLVATLADGKPLRTKVPRLPPLSCRKVPFRFRAVGRGEAGTPLELRVALVRRRKGKDEPLADLALPIEVRRPADGYRRTFVSEIDGSVQAYALRPAAGRKSAAGDPPAIVLTLHGAGVDALKQARQYAPRPWAHVVAPTNRRPYGFDWEDWGRLDALEVLADAEQHLPHDPRRIYLTGHSMGGHGTWHLGASYPDRFAALGPSAGWFSFWSYGGVPQPENPGPLEKLLLRGANPSDTLKLKRNLAQPGVYVLHGSDDKSVPVAQARYMRAALAGFHSDFVYYERPGAGHWWGAECCDWPPLMEFLQRHVAPETEEVETIDFTTCHPGISARNHWVTIEAQRKQLAPSRVQLQLDADARLLTGSTENVTRLALDLRHLPRDRPLRIELDGRRPGRVELPEEGPLWLTRNGERWNVGEQPSPALKGPHRYGTFKDAFRHRVQFVYGTQGSAEENAWALAKARLDAESFWYRGNGSIDVVPDTAFDAKAELDRSVILYGNADTNGAWPALLSVCPVQLRRDLARIGGRPETGDDLACLMIRPRPGSDVASVGVVGGTGLAGMRATNRLRYFVSGVAYPDLLIVGADALSGGSAEIRVLGYFGPDWKMESGEFEWRDVAL